jgi:hypothetical protein
MTLVIWSLSIGDLSLYDNESYFSEWALNYLGLRTAVFSNMSRAASRLTRSSEGEPSSALRHSSQPLSDEGENQNSLRVIRCSQTGIQQQLNTAQIGTVYTYIIWIKDKILDNCSSYHSSIVSYGGSGHPPIEGGSTSNRFVRGNLVGIRGHIIRSLSHWGR